ncbi:hypothetical protein FRD01_16760 [Microvenator marinus]|uniref:Uncharacterized protein n=1 Tax=Microvenator marinus TaxID=2600177 RepID=A0A5B8XU86_9DELT|nr:hypothetical protein [Microvenator marinus]QED28861.1 hypothetical protein FRD01_16760 [Microvenator marinus]
MRVCVNWGIGKVRRFVVRDEGSSVVIIAAERMDPWEDTESNAVDEVVFRILECVEKAEEWLESANEICLARDEFYSIIVITLKPSQWNSVACGQITGAVHSQEAVLALDGGILIFEGHELVRHIVGGDITQTQRLEGTHLNTIEIDFANKVYRDARLKRERIEFEVSIRTCAV